jgi:hypothetical protein
MYTMTARRSKEQIEQLLASELPHPLATVQQRVEWQDARWRVECNQVHNLKTLKGQISLRISPAAEPIYSAVVVPLATDGQLYLVLRYRYAIERWAIEFPRFAFDGSEDGWGEAAKQDLLSMTGLAAEKIALLGAVHTDPALLTSSAIVLLAEGCRPSSQRRRNADTPDVPIAGQVAWDDASAGSGVLVESDNDLLAGSLLLPLNEVLTLARKGDVNCGPTLAALSLFQAVQR